MFNMISIAIFGLSSILVLIAVVMLARSLMLSLNGGQAEGTVTRLVEDAEDHMFAPVVQFQVNSQSYEFQHPIYQNPPYKIGDRVRVLYDRANPQKASIRTFASMYILPILLGVTGCGLAGGWIFLINLN